MSSFQNEVEQKFIKKLQTTIFYNYFSLIIIVCLAGGLAFFFDMKLLLGLLGSPLLVFCIFLFVKKNDDIITSVGIYKYSEIFMEILKSVLPKGANYKKLFNFLGKKAPK